MSKGKRYWSVPTKPLGFTIATTTLNLLTKEAKKRHVSPTKLARFFIERSLGLEKPGMFNSDCLLWTEEDNSHY